MISISFLLNTTSQLVDVWKHSFATTFTDTVGDGAAVGDRTEGVTQDVNTLEQEFVHFSSETSIPVREHHLRYAMNKMNMLSGKTEYPPTLVNLQDDVGILRQHFVPTHAFENAVILRGTFGITNYLWFQERCTFTLEKEGCWPDVCS